MALPHIGHAHIQRPRIGQNVEMADVDPRAETAVPVAARYRCNACGNLTRFDVTATRRTRSFHHYDVSGALEVEETELLSEVVEDVSCRWCGNGSAVVEDVLDGDSPAVSDRAPAETEV